MRDHDGPDQTGAGRPAGVDPDPPRSFGDDHLAVGQEVEVPGELEARHHGLGRQRRGGGGRGGRTTGRAGHEAGPGCRPRDGRCGDERGEGDERDEPPPESPGPDGSWRPPPSGSQHSTEGAPAPPGERRHVRRRPRRRPAPGGRGSRRPSTPTPRARGRCPVGRPAPPGGCVRTRRDGAVTRRSARRRPTRRVSHRGAPGSGRGRGRARGRRRARPTGRGCSGTANTATGEPVVTTCVTWWVAANRPSAASPAARMPPGCAPRGGPARPRRPRAGRRPRRRAEATIAASRAATTPAAAAVASPVTARTSVVRSNGFEPGHGRPHLGAGDGDDPRGAAARRRDLDDPDPSAVEALAEGHEVAGPRGLAGRVGGGTGRTTGPADPQPSSPRRPVACAPVRTPASTPAATASTRS